MAQNLEIERKYLIAMPDEEFLKSVKGASVSKITQTYLVPEIPKSTDRVRASEKDGKTVYTHTVKIKRSASVRYENESVIDKTEYENLLLRADKNLSVIEKKRWKIPFGKGLIAEIDIYPFWEKQAICEVETSEEDEIYSLPAFIRVIREVTEDSNYSNRAMAFYAPTEEI